MSYTGIPEADLITARLETLAGGFLFEGFPDAATHERLSNGGVRPYLSVVYSEVVPRGASGRTLADGEKDIPYVLGFSVTSHADNNGDCKNLMGAVVDLILDWQPNETSTKIARLGGANIPEQDLAKVPSRFQRLGYFTSIINLG